MQREAVRRFSTVMCALSLVACGGASVSPDEHVRSEQLAATACAGLDGEHDGLVPPTLDIVSIAPIRDEVSDHRGTIHPLVGATLTVRGQPGLTAEYLDRVVECHVARCAAGHGRCPIERTSVVVYPFREWFVIELHAEHEGAAERLLEQARQLRTHP